MISRIFRPDFHSFEEAVAYYEARVSRQKEKIIEEASRLKQLQDLLDHNKRELAKQTGDIKAQT